MRLARCLVPRCPMITKQGVCREHRRAAREPSPSPVLVVGMGPAPSGPSMLDVVRLYMAQQAERDRTPQLLVLDESQPERVRSFDEIRMQFDMQALRRRTRP